MLDEDAPRAGEKFRLADSKGGSDNGNDNDNDTRELAEELATLGEEERQALVASMMAQMMRGSGAVGANNVGGTVRANNVGDAVGQPSDMDNESDNPATMLAALLKQRDAVPDVPLHTIQPRPGFVIKTAVRVDRKSSNSSSVDRSADNDSDNVSAFKLFINICQSDEVPAPPPATDTEVQRAVDALLLEGNGAEDDTGPVAVTYRVPLSLSTVRDDVDKGGVREVRAC